MARGIVKQLSEDEVTLALDKRLRQAFRPEFQHSATSSVGGGIGGPTARGHDPDCTNQRQSWRLDKDDVASVFVRLRRNLMGETLNRQRQTLHNAGQ